MLESGSGDTIYAINFFPTILIGLRVFFSLTMFHYVLKLGQLSLDLYLNIIKSGDLGPFCLITDLR